MAGHFDPEHLGNCTHHWIMTLINIYHEAAVLIDCFFSPAFVNLLLILCFLLLRGCLVRLIIP